MSQESVPKHETLLATLQRLLELPTTSVSDTLHQSAQLVATALHAEKVDTFLYDPPSDSLIAYGTSETPLGAKEKVMGLNQLPLRQGGRAVDVYQTGQTYWSGHVHCDPAELPGMKQQLGIKSEILVPLSVADARRGVVLASSRSPRRFTEEDKQFLEAVTHWVGIVIHHAELVEQHTQEVMAQAHRLAAEEILLVLAHDLGNLLTPLKVRLDLLGRRARREGQPVYEREVLAINQAMMRIQQLMTDLLDVARLKQGLFTIEVHPFDLMELLQELVSIWETPEHAMDLHAPAHLIVMADQSRIQQALENLVSNATSHANPQTAVQITIREEEHDHEPWVAVTTSNQGPPIPPDLLATLFLPFAKGAQSQGIGLGLYLAERIAFAHHGTLTVRTETGPTIHFVLSWPRNLDTAYPLG
jgi:two-component system, OmpR family, sensor kinase